MTMRQTATAAIFTLMSASLSAQQLIGYVSTKDATVSGSIDNVEGHAVLAGSVTVTAKDRTAPITLSRGGSLQLCQTTAIRITETRAPDVSPPLLFSLDRGAIQLQMNATASDAVMTPDLRFAVRVSGPLDLRLRVTPNGDTCVENRGVGAPTLAVSDSFGDSSYEVRPNQHVLFEHDSLREVVDHEALPCGCPEPGMSIADALLAPGIATPAAKAASEQHPFPAAVSEGLAPEAPVPQETPGVEHVQVSDSLHYNAPAEVATTAPVPAAPAASPVPAAPLPKKPRGFFHSVGHFFSKLFGS
jgi:hypothetical protein